MLQLDLTGNRISPVGAQGLSMGLGRLRETIGVEVLGVDFTIPVPTTTTQFLATDLADAIMHTTPAALPLSPLSPSALASAEDLVRAGENPATKAEVSAEAEEAAASTILTAALAALGGRVAALNNSASSAAGAPPNPY